MGANSRLAFFTEAGYVFDKFTSEETGAESGEKSSVNVSVKGLHLSGGVLFHL